MAIEVPSLSGVEAKLGRARTHLSTLEESIAAVIGPNLQRFVLDDHDTNGWHALRVYGVPSIDPDWSLLVGDCVHNLRAALDHLAWQLILLDGKTPTKDTQFIIREVPFNKGGQPIEPEFNPRITDPKIRARIEDVQPYRGVNGELSDPRVNPLWVINRLDNIDKHRLLLVMACVPKVLGMWWGLPSHSMGPQVRINGHALNNGSPVAWFDFLGSKPPTDFDPHPAIEIMLNEAGVKRMLRWSIIEALDNLVWWVEDFVVGKPSPYPALYQSGFRQFFP